MSEDKAKRCLICKCELPSTYRLPLCKHHRDSGVDKLKAAGIGVGAFAGGALILVKTGNFEKAKDAFLEHLPR